MLDLREYLLCRMHQMGLQVSAVATGNSSLVY